MEKLAQRTHDDKNGLDYVLVGDYYIPNLVLSEQEKRPIGRWGRMHRTFLETSNPMFYNKLVFNGKLNEYLAGLNEQATNRCFLIISQMTEAEGVTEMLKRENPIEWVRQMNSIKSRAEKIIKHELIYNDFMDID